MKAHSENNFENENKFLEKWKVNTNISKLKGKKNHWFLYIKKTKEERETIIVWKVHILVIHAFI